MHAVAEADTHDNVTMVKRKTPSPPAESPATKKPATRSPLDSARAAVEAGNYSEATALLKELLDKDPDHEPGRHLSAQLHLKSGSLMAAKVAFEALTQEAMQQRDYGRAEGYLREYLEAAARYVPFLELLGQACEAQGKTAEAVTELAKAVVILLEFPDPEDRVHAERLHEKAKALAPDHPEVARLAAALAPPPPPPQETVAPIADAAAAPSEATAPDNSSATTAAPSASLSPSEQPQATEPMPCPDVQIEVAPAPSSPEVETRDAAPEPAQPEPAAAAVAEPVMTSATAPPLIEAAPVVEPAVAPIDNPQSVPEEAASARLAQPELLEAPPSDEHGSLTPRQTPVAESTARPKPEESVELISLEEWLHEPLSPEPLARIQPKPPARTQETTIPLPDQSGKKTDKRWRAKRKSPEQAAALQGMASRVQIEMRAPEPTLDPVQASAPTESIRREAATPEQAGVEARSVNVDLSTAVEQEPATDIGQDHPRQAAASPITALDPDLKAELETFLKEKTPLTDRAQAFSPFPESQPDQAPLSEGTDSSVQDATPPRPEAPEEMAGAALASEESAPSISDSVASAEVMEQASLRPEEVPVAEPAPVSAEPEMSVAQAAVEPEPLPLQAEPDLAPIHATEDVPIPQAETMPEPTVPLEPAEAAEAIAPMTEGPAWELEPEIATQDHVETQDAWQPVEESPDAIPPIEAARDQSPAPIEELAWAPHEEVQETPTAVEDPLPDMAEEAVSEQPPEPHRTHKAHPCALCQEAEAEEARLRRAKSGVPEVPKRSRSILSRPLRQIKRWVSAGISTVTDTTLTATDFVVRLVLLLSTMAVGLPVMALAVVTAAWLLMEQKPNANYLELTQAPPRAVEEPTKNGYYLLLGFGAEESVDALKTGYQKWKTAQEDQSRQCFGLATGARPSMAFPVETRALALWLQARDPVAELQREQVLVQRWAAQHRVLMTRYQHWLTMPFEDRGYGNFASPDCAQVLTAHRLYLAEGLVRRTSEGLDRLERDLIAWRNVLARSKTMATKLLAAQAVKEDIAILATVAERGTAEAATLPRFAHLVRPFDQVERSLRWPMQNELLLEVRRVESGLRAKDDKEQEPGWLTTLLTHLPLPKQRALNAHADYYEALIRAPEQGRHTPTDPYAYTNSPAQDALDYLINPVDNLLLTPDHLSWQHEASLLFDADARLRTLVASRVFQPRPSEPLTAKAQPQSVDAVPTLVSEASPL